MSSLAFLVTELQSLASETKRKHPEVREAAEKSLAILRSSPEQATANLASDGPQSDDLLRPVFMGCATKNAKVVAISLGSLQRLISLKAVPLSAVALIISTMYDAVSQGVDIQLRILQTLLSLVTNFPDVHGDLLGDALLLCFKLQESRIAVVSSTAAATLRQLVMFVFDKIVEEDRRDSKSISQFSTVTLPDGTTKDLGPSAHDAFSVFEDLCLLANSEKPNFLKLESLHKTFALELIESVLTNYHDLFRKHPELLLLLQHHLCPLLLKAMSDRPMFPLTLRCTRVVFLLLKQFSVELETEAEVFLMLLIRIISEDDGSSAGVGGNESQGSHVVRPQWMRVLAMEIMRGLCSDAELIRNVWARYDSQSSGSKIFTSLTTALKRLVTEKPALLGVSSQMFGVGVSTSSSDASGTSGYGLDVGGVAGMVATAASATVSGVVGMMGSGGGLTLQGSAMKLQCIDQLDKADSPPIPESYVYLLGVQCLTSLCEGFISFVGPLYSSIIVQRPKVAGEAIIRAPPAFDFSALSPAEPSTKHLQLVRDMVDSGWPALLAALSFIVSTNLSDELFAEVLSALVAMTNVSGMLALSTPRDAFFASLAKFAVPSRVVSSLDSYVESATPRSASMLTENLGLTAPVQPPGLSERNMACLKALVSTALFLAGSLGESWFGILETLQNADYVLTSKGSLANQNRRSSSVAMSRAASMMSPTSQSGSSSGPGSAQRPSPRHSLLTDLDTESLQGAIQRFFDSSKNLEDAAFKDFVNALCKLSSEMVGMQSDGSRVLLVESDSIDDEFGMTGLAPKSEPAHRRRVSGIHLPRTLRAGDFGINKLGSVAFLNIHRLIYRSPEIAWNTTTTHLLSVIRLSTAPQPIRVQAARVLDEILVIVPRNLSTTGELQPQVQRRVLDVLSQQVLPHGTTSSSTELELRRMGLNTLHQLLQASGHTLVVGWETIFEMLGSVCKPLAPFRSGSIDTEVAESSPPSPTTPRNKPAPLGIGYPAEKSMGPLVKVAFQSLKLVCDSVSSLSSEHLRLCISTLGQFGRQSDTNIALTAAESLLWSVSDAIQAKRKDAEKEPEYSALWMFLLLEVLRLCEDSRSDVRVGAIQTLFRTMQLYGATLSLATWNECLWKVTFPLLESITREIRHNATASPAPLTPLDTASSSPTKAWDDSKILALQSIGSIFHDFLMTKIMCLDSFTEVWSTFVTHIQDCVLQDSISITTHALRCLEKATKALSFARNDLKDKVADAWECVWKSCDEIGGAVVEKGSLPLSPTQATDGQTFSQECLVAYVDLIMCTRVISRSQDGHEWLLERLVRLMAILKGVLTYSRSPDYRPDIDGMTPVQTVVTNAIQEIDLTAPGAPSIVMRDLSEYASLPFLASFEVPFGLPNNNGTPSKQPRKRITYIALVKYVMPKLVELFLEFKNSAVIYVDGTLEAVLSAYSIPIKLKYDCPPPSKFGKEQPLWKTATTSFLKVVRECASQIKVLGPDIPDDRVEALWRQINDVFRGGILADCSIAESFSLEEQDAEENFDLALISALEIDVVPHLGDPRVPDFLVIQLAKVLQQGSRLYEIEPRSRHSDTSRNSMSNGHATQSNDFAITNLETIHDLGSTDSGSLVPRERFAYWCFDLLFLLCSNTAKDQESSRKRMAALSLPSLLNRCQMTLVGFVADESLRGNLPFPRAREDELLYVLRKLLSLKLWPGTLWAALSESPSQASADLPDIDISLSASDLIADAVKRSSLAHLFHFYPILCEIVSIPRKLPSAWVGSSEPLTVGKDDSKSHNETNQANGISHLDARALARECLKQVGKEIGVGR